MRVAVLYLFDSFTVPESICLLEGVNVCIVYSRKYQPLDREFTSKFRRLTVQRHRKVFSDQVGDFRAGGRGASFCRDGETPQPTLLVWNFGRNA